MHATLTTSSAGQLALRASGDELARQSHVIRSLALVETVLDSIEQWTAILNGHMQIVFANRSLRSFLGANGQEDVLGLRPGEALGCIHATEAPGGCGTTVFCSFCGFQEAFLSGRDATVSGECRVTRPGNVDGRDLRVQVAPLELEGERFSLLSLLDISDTKRRRVLEQIFFHDIRNSAASVKSLAEAFLYSDSRERGELVAHVVLAAERLLNEITSQRFLFLAEAGALECHPVTLESSTILGDLAAIHRGHPAAHGRHLEVSPASQRVDFTSDRGLITRVLGNMILNGLEAVEPGATVTLDCQPWNDGVLFRVHNPGVVPDDVRLQVFQRSFSTKGEGRGIGTYGMKLLGERYLKGRIGFISSQAAGTSFTAWFPARMG